MITLSDKSKAELRKAFEFYKNKYLREHGRVYLMDESGRTEWKESSIQDAEDFAIEQIDNEIKGDPDLDVLQFDELMEAQEDPETESMKRLILAGQARECFGYGSSLKKIQ